ncbi:MAG: hypothetical protein ACO34E_12170 [Limisphaerales bacterium]
MRVIAGVLGLLVVLGLGAQGAERRDVFSDTWVATDGLGRQVATQEEVGEVRTGKTVGIFYFLWLGTHGRELYDISKLLEADPGDPAYGPRGAFHFWGEPLFGYYLSEDRWVIRKHAQMLTDAGVDVVFFDVTNAFTYDPVVVALCEVYTQMRETGQATPQIAFLAHSAEGEVVRRLHENFYKPGRYRDLWFEWLGKPLILAAPVALDDELRSFFTVRESWAWGQGEKWFQDGRDKWPWVDHYPQSFGWHRSPSEAEQVAVAVAQHPVSNIGRSYHEGEQPPPEARDPARGWCFSEQWERALELDPQVVFITGWNEWVAQRFIGEGNGPGFLGRQVKAGETYFVDQYNQEFSRDIEPMRGGHGDAYYYQMVSNIRRYKGARKLEPVSASEIAIDGEFGDWEGVVPEFRDTLGDPVLRDHDGWNGAGRYKDATGRNDLSVAKVAVGGDAVFFYIRAREPFIGSRDEGWMELYLDTDQDVGTGWLGYDFVVKERPGGGRALFRRCDTGWEDVSGVVRDVGEREMELAVPKALLGVGSGPVAFDFKWADNLPGTGDWTDFSLHGDVAPNERFNYRAVGAER